MALQALLTYYAGEIAAAGLERTPGAAALSASAAFLKPAWAWGVLACYLGAAYPVGAKLAVGAHLLTTAAMYRHASNPVAQRYLFLPAVAGVSGLVVPGVTNWPASTLVDSAALGADATVPGTVPLILLGLHLFSVLQELVRSMVFPAPFVAQLTPLEQARDHALQKTHIHPIGVPSTAGVQLCGAILAHPHMSEPLKARRWLVYVGGNGEVWEHSWYNAHDLAVRLNANAVVFNFRGVGRSGGRTKSATDLVQDLNDVLAYLLKRFDHISAANIVLFGHSIGGGVAAQVAANHHPGVGIVLDRSFSSLVDAAVGVVGLPPGITTFGLAAAFGDLNTAEAWEKLMGRAGKHNLAGNGGGRTVVSYHKSDRIIQYNTASLGRLSVVQRSAVAVELVGTHGDVHNCGLFALGGASTVMSRIQAMFP